MSHAPPVCPTATRRPLLVSVRTRVTRLRAHPLHHHKKKNRMCLYTAPCARSDDVPPPPASGKFLCRPPTVIRSKKERGLRNLNGELVNRNLEGFFFFLVCQQIDHTGRSGVLVATIKPSWLRAFFLSYFFFFKQNVLNSSLSV